MRTNGSILLPFSLPSRSIYGGGARRRGAFCRMESISSLTSERASVVHPSACPSVHGCQPTPTPTPTSSGDMCAAFAPTKSNCETQGQRGSRVDRGRREGEREAHRAIIHLISHSAPHSFTPPCRLGPVGSHPLRVMQSAKYYEVGEPVAVARISLFCSALVISISPSPTDGRREHREHQTPPSHL